MKKFFFASMLLFSIFLILNLNLYSQISKPGIPLSKVHNQLSEVSFYTLPKPNIDSVLNAENSGSKLKPLRYSVPVFTNFSTENDGKWLELDKGKKIWFIGLVCENAFSLSINFQNFHLDKNAELYLYSPSEKKNFRAFTEINNKATGVFATAPISGDSIIIELNVDSMNADLNTFTISEVYYDFLDIFKTMQKDGSYGNSGDCNIDINCAEGDDWQREKRSVCRLLTGGSLCSGTLVNNTSNDGKPYFLTANHCVSTQQAASNMILVFNYESPSCNGPDGSVQQSISGSTLKATTYTLDFCLVELSETPPASYQPYYSGWSRNTTAAKNTVCIHHPQGDVKKISKDFDPPITGNYGGTFDANSHWQIVAWDLATTEGGSSGSPLFDQFHRVVGDLTGGEATCSNSVNDYFAKFSRSWQDYPNAENQLKYWLDPTNLGTMNLNGYDPYYGSQPPIADFSSNTQTIMVGSTIDFFDISQGNISAWNWTFAGSLTPTSTTQHPSAVKYMTEGTFTVTLTVSNANGTDTETKTAYINVLPGCDRFSNITETDIPALFGFGTSEWGFWTGHNEHTFTDFAEQFTNLPGDYIHGVYICPGKAYYSTSSSKITIKVWQGGALPGNEIHSQDIPINQFVAGNYKYVTFSPTIATSGSFFIGYSIYYDKPDTFAVLHAQPRGVGELNTAYIKMQDVWYPITNFSNSFTTSLYIEPYNCGIAGIEDFEIQQDFKIFPNPCSDIAKVIFPESINNNSKLFIYNSLGVLVNTFKINSGSNHIEFNVSDLEQGIYIIRFFDGENYSSARLIKINDE